MSSRLLRLLLGLSLLLNTFVLVGFIYRSWIVPPPFERHAPPSGPRPSATETVMHEVGLDDEQRKSLRPTLDRYLAERRERLREIQKLRDELSDEYKRPAVDMTRVDGLVDKLAKLRGELQKEMLHSLDRFGGQLKPAQRERMHQILAERLAAPPALRQSSSSPGPGRPSQ